MSPTLSPLCSRSVPRLREALGHPVPTGAPKHSPIHPQQVPQEGLGLLPCERGERLQKPHRTAEPVINS